MTLLRRKINATITMATTQPTTIPPIAPPEMLLPEELDVLEPAVAVEVAVLVVRCFVVAVKAISTERI